MTDQQSNIESSGRGEDQRTRTLSIIGTELLFVLLPFIAIAAIELYKGNILSAFHASEWSFAAVILTGQSLVKFVSGFLSRNEPLYWEKVALIATALIVLMLVPSMLILVFVLISDPLSPALVVLQIVWFAIAVVVFIALGTLGQSLIS